MTVAAGFANMDGVIICADTQETIQGYAKNTTEKIDLFADAHFTIGITGAGDTHFINGLSQRLMSVANLDRLPGNYLYGDRARELMEEEYLKFFREHLLIYSQAERASVEPCLLIAMQCYHNRYLLKATGGMISDLDPGKSRGADCVGVGEILGHSLIERFYSPFMELDDMVIAACYVVYQAKKWVDGCSGNTDILVLTNEYRMGMGTHDIQALEGFFATYDEEVGYCLAALASPLSSGSDAENSIKRARRELLRCRKKLMKSESLAAFFARIDTQKKSFKPSVAQTSAGQP